jgi:hypothetical protein
MVAWKALLAVVCVLAAALGAEAGTDAEPQQGVYAPDAPAKKGVLAPAAGPDDRFMRFRRSALLSSRSKKGGGGGGGGGKDECENDADCSSGKYCNLALKDTECQKGGAAAAGGGGGGGGW